MSQQRHTMGPWETFGLQVVSERTGHCICTVEDQHTPYPTKRANALLVASAPEMLSALEKVVLGGAAVLDDSWYKNAAAIIARAKGGA